MVSDLLALGLLSWTGLTHLSRMATSMPLPCCVTPVRIPSARTILFFSFLLPQKGHRFIFQKKKPKRLCVATGKVPYKFLQARRTIKIIENLSTRLGLAADEIAIPFLSGPYQGTWVHRDLALRLAEYCDDTCHLETAVGQAISALTDRTPAAAPAPFTAPTVPLSEQERALSLVHVAAAEAQAIAIKGDAAAAAEEKTFAVRVKQAELEERRLAVAKQYTKLERSHLKDVGNIQVINTERQAAAKRKQQEESAAQAKKHAKMQAETQAAKDKQDQLRRQTAQQPTRLSLVPHRNAASNLRTGSTPMSGTFVMDEAVHKAAEKMGIAYSQVIKFMRAKRGNKTGYQKVLEDTHLVKKGTQVRVNENIGYYPVGVYPKSKLDAAVKWIRRKYTAQG